MSSPESRPLPNWLAVALVVGTSAAILVLEILAGRLLAPYVGVSLDTYTGIIGTVLVGIAIGAWVGGIAADRTNPRALIPVLLVLGGALAIATIPTVRALGSAGASTGLGGILVLTAVGFLPSATVLSAVPPAVVKLQLRSLDTTGATVGRLSAYGTAGAIVATFLTGFVLVAVAAVTTLIVGVGVLLVASGLGLWILGPRPSRAATAGSVGALSAFAGVALVGATLLGSPCDTQTDYYCVTIVVDDDRPGGRTLVLDDLRHSYVVADDPTHLEFWYTRRFADAVDLFDLSRPIDVVHVGGGAMTVPTWVQTMRPDSRQVVFEIDDQLIELAVEEFDRTVGPGTGLDVVAGDARLSLADRPDDSADLVVGDAFGSRAVPWHLATTEFVADIDRVLRPGGVYVLNVIDGPAQDFLAAQARTIAETLQHVAVVLGPAAAEGRLGNSVIVASDEPFADLDADGGRLVDDLDGFLADAPLLTDVFAPVDQLLARSR
jgi:SAM-dependent methyltransferase